MEGNVGKDYLAGQAVERTVSAGETGSRTQGPESSVCSPPVASV